MSINDAKQPSQNIEEVANVSGPRDIVASASRLAEHDGSFLIPECAHIFSSGTLIFHLMLYVLSEFISSSNPGNSSSAVKVMPTKTIKSAVPR